MSSAVLGKKFWVKRSRRSGSDIPLTPVQCRYAINHQPAYFFRLQCLQVYSTLLHNMCFSCVHNMNNINLSILFIAYQKISYHHQQSRQTNVIFLWSDPYTLLWHCGLHEHSRNSCIRAFLTKSTHNIGLHCSREFTIAKNASKSKPKDDFTNKKDYKSLRCSFCHCV